MQLVPAHALENDSIAHRRRPAGRSPRQQPPRGLSRGTRAGGGPVCPHPQCRRQPAGPRRPRRPRGSGERIDSDRGSAPASIFSGVTSSLGCPTESSTAGWRCDPRSRVRLLCRSRRRVAAREGSFQLSSRRACPCFRAPLARRASMQSTSACCSVVGRSCRHHA